MKLVDVNSITYMDFYNKNSKEDSKFKGSDHIRISKYKKIFAKGDVPNWSKKFFLLQNIKILLCGHMLLVILMVKKLLERFTKKNCKKTNKKGLRVKKVI